MKRTIGAFLVFFTTTYFLSFAPLIEASVSLTAPSAVLLNPATDKILYSRAPHRKQAPASTTKLITALVVLDRLPLKHWVTISHKVEQAEASKLYLNGGDRLRVHDLLKALLINSANDVAQALAIEVAGSEAAFGELLTQKARSLGARNTRFRNASGLPAEGQYSTAYDLALIMREAMKNDIIMSILRQRSAVIYTAAGKRFVLKTHNKMLLRSKKVFGKTGWTRRAKYCFVGLIEEGNAGAIVAVLGSKKLWGDLNELVDHATGREHNTLAYRARGGEVRQLQLALKRAGFFKGEATGYFGQKTKQAVLQFQRSRGLSADGIVGIHTRRALAPYL